jgi:hypothetical protein
MPGISAERFKESDHRFIVMEGLRSPELDVLTRRRHTVSIRPNTWSKK